jgi:hypothetical protein
MGGVRVSAACLLFLAGIGLAMVVAAFILGFMRAIDWPEDPGEAEGGGRWLTA